MLAIVQTPNRPLHLTEKSSSACRAYFSLPIWLFDRHHSWKAKNIPWAGRKSLRNKGRKNIRAMAHKNDYQIQKQLDKPQTWFCKYYPARIRNVGEKEIADRQLVFDFKDGRAYEEVAQRTAENMLTSAICVWMGLCSRRLLPGFVFVTGRIYHFRRRVSPFQC